MKRKKRVQVSPAASDKQQQHFRGEHRAVSTSSGSITAVLYAATLPVPIVWGHVDEMSAGWWRVAHRVVLVAPVPVAPRRVGFDEERGVLVPASLSS